MTTLKEAIKLCRIEDDEIVWLTEGAADSPIGCIPMTGAEIRKKYDMKNTLVTAIDMHGFEEISGFTFAIKKASDRHNPDKTNIPGVSDPSEKSAQTVTDEQHVQVFYRDGYHAAAKRLEQLKRECSREAEYKFLLSYAGQSCFDDDECRDCLQILWTAYCLHHNLDVDTDQYDNDLLNLWNKMEDAGNTGEWADYNDFDNHMCSYLV